METPVPFSLGICLDIAFFRLILFASAMARPPPLLATVEIALCFLLIQGILQPLEGLTGRS